MTLGWLGAAYLVVGVVVGALVLRREAGGPRRWLSAAAAGALWPLFGPFAFSPRSVILTDATEPATAGRIEAALTSCRDAVADTELAPLFDDAQTERILKAVREAAQRLAALDGELARVEAAAQRRRHVGPHPVQQAPGIATSKRSHDPAHTSAPGAAVASGDHGVALNRLQALRARDASRLTELAEVAELCHAELVLARFGSLGGAEHVIAELWARADEIAEPLPSRTART